MFYVTDLDNDSAFREAYKVVFNRQYRHKNALRSKYSSVNATAFSMMESPKRRLLIARSSDKSWMKHFSWDYNASVKKLLKNLLREALDRTLKFTV